MSQSVTHVSGFSVTYVSGSYHEVPVSDDKVPVSDDKVSVYDDEVPVYDDKVPECVNRMPKLHFINIGFFRY